MNKERSIALFNSLVEINNDRIEGYQKASKETSDAEMKELFFQMMQTSRKCNVDLSYEIYKMEGEPTDGTKITGKFFRAWMDLKAALTGNNKRVILESCEFGEVAAVEAYEKVLNGDRSEFSGDQNLMLYNQYAMIKGDRDRIRELRKKI